MPIPAIIWRSILTNIVDSLLVKIVMSSLLTREELMIKLQTTLTMLPIMIMLSLKTAEMDLMPPKIYPKMLKHLIRLPKPKALYKPTTTIILDISS